jgi:hypothetical protein
MIPTGLRKDNTSYMDVFNVDLDRICRCAFKYVFCWICRLLTHFDDYIE